MDKGQMGVRIYNQNMGLCIREEKGFFFCFGKKFGAMPYNCGGCWKNSSLDSFRKSLLMLLHLCIFCFSRFEISAYECCNCVYFCFQDIKA